MFKVGDLVEVRPVAYPAQVWRGKVERKAKHGFKVRYASFGVEFSEVFNEGELSHV